MLNKHFSIAKCDFQSRVHLNAHYYLRVTIAQNNQNSDNFTVYIVYFGKIYLKDFNRLLLHTVLIRG